MQRHIDTDQLDVILLKLDLKRSDADWDLLWLRQDRATAARPELLCSVDRARLLAHHRQLQTWLCRSLAQPCTTEQVLTAVPFKRSRWRRCAAGQSGADPLRRPAA